jgi:hypothetical protein
LYSSPSIIRMIKSRRMKWAGHVARMGENRNAYKILVESQKIRDHWEYQDVCMYIVGEGLKRPQHRDHTKT